MCIIVHTTSVVPCEIPNIGSRGYFSSPREVDVLLVHDESMDKFDAGLSFFGIVRGRFDSSAGVLRSENGTYTY